MAFGIQDRLSIQITINDVEVDLQQNILDYLHIAESVQLFLPMAVFRIKDVNQTFSAKNLLVDGVLVNILVGVEGQTLAYPMRLFSHKELTIDGTQAFLMTCYLDTVPYWTSSMVETQNGTASQVLKTICDAASITYAGETTNDQQIWIPRNQKLKQFAREIATHAYVDDKSCCQMAVTASGVMRLVNVTNFWKFPLKVLFSNTPNNTQLQIMDWAMMNKSGFYNSVSGYKDFHVQQSHLADDKITKSTPVTKNTQKLSMNEEVAGDVSQNRVRYAPIDIGNTSDSHERARYQNERLANLFSNGISILTNRLVEADLFDVVNCSLSRPGVEGVSNISGRYIMTSKVLYLENNNFYQKIEAYRHGLNDQSESTQF